MTVQADVGAKGRMDGRTPNYLGGTVPAAAMAAHHRQAGSAPHAPEQLAACTACCSADSVRLVFASEPQVTFVSEMACPGPGSRSAAGPAPCLQVRIVERG